LKQYVHEYKQIVIGGSLEALRFAYASGYPLLCIPQKPHFFRPTCGAEWERLAFLLSVSGQLPLADNLSSIRIDEDTQEIKCFTKNSRVVAFSYATAYVVDDLDIDGLPLPSVPAKKEYLVFDWINIRCGGNHSHDSIEDESEDFVKRIVFYPSERVTSKRADRKDGCAVSVLTEAQLKSLDYSESYVLLKSREMMKEAGIKGSRNGTQATTGKPAYLSLKIEVAGRETHPLHKNQYEDTPTLKFNNFIDKDNVARYNKYLEYQLGRTDERGNTRGSKNPSRQTKS